MRLTRTAIISGIATAVLGLIASRFFVAYLIKRTLSMRRKQEWLQSGEMGLGMAMFGEQQMKHSGKVSLGFLVKYFDAHAGAIFVRDGEEFKRVSTYGVPAESNNA